MNCIAPSKGYLLSLKKGNVISEQREGTLIFGGEKFL